MDSIIYHQNHQTQTTYSTHLTEGCVNPLRRTAWKQIININSRFRDNYYLTPSTDFFVTLPGIPSKVTSMRLVKVTLPNFIYTVNKNTGSDNFYIKVNYFFGVPPNSIYESHIFLKSGSYSGEEIANEITNALNFYLPPALKNRIKGFYNKITGKICFTIEWLSPLVGAAVIEEVTLCFNYIEPCKGFLDCSANSSEIFCKNKEIFSQTPNTLYKDQLSLGWILGFRGNYVYKFPKDATTDPIITNFLTNGIKHQEPYVTRGLSRKELKNLSNITPRRARVTQVKNNGMQYLEPTYNCCDPSGQMFEPNDISFCYQIVRPNTVPIKLRGKDPAPGPFTTDSSNNFCGESIYDPISNRYFLLSVNDYQNNHTRALISPMQEEALHDSYILGKVYGPCCDCCIDGNERIYFGPCSINRLHIKLLDEFGRVVDLNNGDFSFSIELELLYDL